MTAPRILACDCASRLGWAYGPAGGRPRSGSLSCAARGASRGAIFNGAGRWAHNFVAENPVDMLVVEKPIISGAPMPEKTAEILHGLPAVLEFMVWQLGVHDHRRAAVASIRKHFLGSGRIRGAEAKSLVHRKCRALGWIAADDEDQSYDRSDALAIWSYAETMFAPPRLAQPVDDLFLAGARA